jgi:HEAT repeat protein
MNSASQSNIDVRVLLKTMYHEFDEDVREAALGKWERIDKSALRLELNKLLNDDDGDIRCDAATALLEMAAGGNLPQVLPLLSDGDKDVRWHICGLLMDFGDSRAEDSLANLLLHDPIADVRFIAASALGKCGTEASIAALESASSNDSGVDREGRSIKDECAESIRMIRAR